MFGRWSCLAPLALACAAPAALAQETADTQRLELRVTDGEAGRATLDRGRVDGLRVGDRVVLRPREGLPIEGHVVEVSERSARMEFDDAARSAAPGTRGEAWIPRDRVASEPAPEPAPAVQAPVDHPAWPVADKDWKQGMPLLNEVPALHPGQRPARVSGRWYVISDQQMDVDGDRSWAFERAGLDLDWSNPFGNGADLHFAGEGNWRNTVVPDADDEHEARLRLDRLSYVVGGNRFENVRWEFGRFLQYAMPELGVLDGVEWTQRIVGGNSYGTSLGYMPEPDAAQQSFRDLQIAAWYRWVGDETERSALLLGFQKSFHDYSSDRDLLIARVDLVPRGAWSLHGGAWVDFYTPHDEQKNADVELTQANLSIQRQFVGGSSLVLTGTHVSFPQMDRWEFPTVSNAQLASDHVERLALRGRQNTEKRFWLFEEAGLWTDQDDRGGDLEAGLELDHAIFEGGRLRFSTFGTQGATDTVLGIRGALGRQLEDGSWELGYQFAQHEMQGFSSGNDQIPQHRVRVSRDFHSPSGWSFSFHAEWLHYADVDSIAAGIYLQRSF